MLHSLRIRLMLLTTILPMVAIGAAGLLIRDANSEAIGGAGTFEAVSAPAYQVMSGTRVREGAGGDGSFKGESKPLPGQELGQCPGSLITTDASGEVRPLDESAVSVIYRGVAGDQFLVAAAPSFVQDFEAGQRDTVSSLNLKVLAVTGSAGLICALVGFLASERMFRPVTELTRAARRLEAGDLDQRVECGGRDEVGQLSHAFNAMAESLHRNEQLRKKMTSDIAHELRTPLNNVSGFVDMIADGLVEPDARVLETIQSETQLLVTLVADLEQLALGDAGQIRLELGEADPGELVERAVTAMGPRAAERSVQLSAEVAEDAGDVMADTARIDQVLRNLVENAIRHTPEGGGVRVAVAAEPDAVAITVTDSGPGIAPEHLPFIFERFYRADSSRNRRTGGSGLGLAIARQLVEAHGGTIAAANVPGCGAEVRIRLPRRAGPGEGGRELAWPGPAV